jgi:hypothetical protein
MLPSRRRRYGLLPTRSTAQVAQQTKEPKPPKWLSGWTTKPCQRDSGPGDLALIRDHSRTSLRGAIFHYVHDQNQPFAVCISHHVLTGIQP